MHLNQPVRLCLQSRRAAVSALLGIKKNVMNITMDGIHDFGSGVHAGNLTFMMLGTYTMLLFPAQ